MKSSIRLCCLAYDWLKNSRSQTLELRCDLQLVASQLRGEYEDKNEIMEQYLKLAQSLMGWILVIRSGPSPIAENIMANALASLASIAIYPCHVEISIMDHPSIYSTKVLTAENQAGHS